MNRVVRCATIVLVVVAALLGPVTSAQAEHFPICADSGVSFPEVTSVERVSGDVSRPGGQILTEVTISGGEAPYRVIVNYYSDDIFTHIFTTAGAGDSPVVVAEGFVAADIKLGDYTIYNVVITDDAGCDSAYFGSEFDHVVQLQPNPGGSFSHNLDLDTPGFTSLLHDDWGYVAGSNTIGEITAAVDYQSTDGDTLRLYRAFLNRDPDVPGGVYWIQQSRLGANPDDLSYGFAQSAEFIGRYGALSNEDFLTLIYDNMLGRAPDPDGFAYWLGLMNDGLDQFLVVRWVVANDEFINRFPFAASVPGNPGDNKNCGDFSRQAEAQAWFDHYYPHYGDVARLDQDNNLRPCESLR